MVTACRSYKQLESWELDRSIDRSRFFASQVELPRNPNCPFNIIANIHTPWLLRDLSLPVEAVFLVGYTQPTPDAYGPIN